LLRSIGPLLDRKTSYCYDAQLGRNIAGIIS
jgi:hypothetical protein